MHSKIVWLGRLLAFSGIISIACALEDTQTGTAGTATNPGGAANANATSTDPANTATANGGAALGGSALAGGAAMATATTQHSTPATTTVTTATARGGASSFTLSLAAQPAGGDAEAHANVLNGAAGQNISLFSTATGGSSGGARGGNATAGNGGNASAFLDGQANGANSLTGTANATGGGIFPGLAPSGGGNGGTAYALGRLINAGGTRAALTINATGANGGDWNANPGSTPQFRAGAGGGASVGEAFASAAESVTVAATARGGNGGIASRGFGGSGASINLENAVNGAAGNQVDLSQTAIAGSGGTSGGALGVAGGSAFSRLDRTISTHLLLGATTATGGAGGASVFIGGNFAPGDGGSATALTLLTNPTGAVQAISTATTAHVAGSSGGRAGSAEATAEANSAQAEGTLGAIARATATAGSSPTLGGTGGNATASATARSQGGTTSAVATASSAGAPPVDGNVLATATAVNAGAGGASADATATALGGNRTIVASASASAAGYAVSRIAGTSTSSGPGAPSPLAARVGLGVAAPSSSGTSGVFGTGAPTAAEVSPFLAGNPNAAARLDLASASQRLALATFSGSRSFGASSVPLSFTLGLTVDLAQLPLAERGHLQLALLGANGAGFTSLHLQIARDGIVQVDVTFLSLSEATSYFTDQVLDLGALGSAATGNVNLAVTMDFIGLDSFTTNMFAGNAPIPEPATWLLLLAGTAVLTLRGRISRL